MQRHVIVGFVFTMLVIAAPASQADTPQTPSEPKVIEQTANFGLNPPDTLNTQVQDADAVIRAELLSGVVKTKSVSPETLRETGHHPFGAAPKVFTEYSLRVTELLKHPRRDQPSLQVGQAMVGHLVGEYRWRDYLIRANADAPVLERGRDYVLVLGWSEELGAYAIDPNGIYELDAAGVGAKGRIPAAKAQNGRSKDEFLKEVRQAGQMSGSIESALLAWARW